MPTLPVTVPFRSRATLPTLVACAVLLPTACAPARRAAPDPFTPSATIAAFEQLARQRGSLTFRFFNGKALRTDSDTELTFYPDGSAHMFEWGYTLNRYAGTWHAHPDGCIVAQFKNFAAAWPVMSAHRDGDTWTLWPFDEDQIFVSGNRGGATAPNDRETYWPFRVLTGADEKQVLDQIRERS